MQFNSFSKVLFDLVMLILLTAVYCAQPTGIPVHEYIGTAVYLLFIIHLAYNYRWIIGVGKKFFDKAVSPRVKLMYAVDWLLLIAFILIGLSGVMISRVLFKFGKMPVWRPMHSIASAVSLILLALHAGLHGKMIVHAVKTKVKLSFRGVKIAVTLSCAVILPAGIYGEIASRVQPSQNQARPPYETASALFARSIRLLSGPPEYVRNRIAVSAEKEEKPENSGENRPNSAERRVPPQRAFSLQSLLISLSNYIAFILLCSLLVFLTDIFFSNKRKKRRAVISAGAELRTG
ncbi:MAG: DUF4405 domain-containing protein [Spirochaetaceae bacterium]|jgi:hypothetical protein|nr:DUF4405 domain-containing protein [Spirochaetaceae bacterium]